MEVHRNVAFVIARRVNKRRLRVDKAFFQGFCPEERFEDTAHGSPLLNEVQRAALVGKAGHVGPYPACGGFYHQDSSLPDPTALPVGQMMLQALRKRRLEGRGEKKRIYRRLLGRQGVEGEAREGMHKGLERGLFGLA